MAGHGEKFERKLELAVAALLSEPTVEAAAAKVGVGYATLKSWLKDPEFAAAYAEARREVLERSVARLLALTDKAVKALERNLDCGKPSGENRAAALVFEHAYRGVEVLDLARQLAELRAEMLGRLSHVHGDPGAGAGEAAGRPSGQDGGGGDADTPGPGPPPPGP
jgi:hypothetical protein